MNLWKAFMKVYYDLHENPRENLLSKVDCHMEVCLGNEEFEIFCIIYASCMNWMNVREEKDYDVVTGFKI
jgi:hypothetical protein